MTDLWFVAFVAIPVFAVTAGWGTVLFLEWRDRHSGSEPAE